MILWNTNLSTPKYPFHFIDILLKTIKIAWKPKDYMHTAGISIAIVPENDSGTAFGVCGSMTITWVLTGAALYRKPIPVAKIPIYFYVKTTPSYLLIFVF